jgi:hypothetical protein
VASLVNGEKKIRRWQQLDMIGVVWWLDLLEARPKLSMGEGATLALLGRHWTVVV